MPNSLAIKVGCHNIVVQFQPWYRRQPGSNLTTVVGSEQSQGNALYSLSKSQAALRRRNRSRVAHLPREREELFCRPRGSTGVALEPARHGRPVEVLVRMVPTGVQAATGVRQYPRPRTQTAVVHCRPWHLWAPPLGAAGPYRP